MFDVNKVRGDFPMLNEKINGKILVYFDNAATSLKPQSVVDTITKHYQEEASNVHRGVHTLSVKATEAYEQAREKVRSFLNARSSKEIIATRGTTDSINLIAQTYGRQKLKAGDEILLSQMEHHSNMVPWQILAKEKDLKIKYIPLNRNGELDLSGLKELLTEKVKLVSVNAISNSLGTINPIKEIISEAHKVGAVVSVDAAQAVIHQKLDVQDLDCEFLSFSAHKMLGPTGFGILYGKEEILRELEPVDGGGDMIQDVSLEGSTWNDLPFKFEAGTPHIAGFLGTAAAIEYLEKLDYQEMNKYEKELLDYATQKLSEIEGVEIYANHQNKVPILSFNIKGIHASDLGTLIDQEGVAIRTGHHCTMPVMKYFEVAGSARASLNFYNTKEEVDRFISALKKAKEMLS